MDTGILDALGIKYGTDKSSKVHNYLDKYEIFLQTLRDENFTLLEIGGLNGASLKMWREYFPGANVVCLDINPEVKQFESDRITVEIGDTGNHKFLKSVIAKYSNLRVILDDGSHRWDHMRIAFRNLYPVLEQGGFYIVEDIHTNYTGRYAGTDDSPFTRSLYDICDVMSARGDVRRGMGQTLSPSIFKAGATTEYMAFLGRSCLLKKARQVRPSIGETPP